MLTAKEQRLVAEVCDALGSSLDLEEVVRASYPLLLRAVPADYAALGVTKAGQPNEFDWLVAEMPKAFFAAYPDMAAHDFVLRSVLAAPNRVLRDTEMLPRRELEANIMYERARDLGTPLEHVMSTMLHADGDWASGVSLYRSELRPFSDRDRAVLAAIIPALRNAVRNCRRFAARECSERSLVGLMAARGLAALILIPPAHELARTPSVTSLIEKWFAASDRDSSHVPRAVLDQLSIWSSAADPSVTPSWVLQGPSGALTVRPFWTSSQGTRCVALLFEETPATPQLPEDWLARLTKRETEVVEKLLEGFDNRFIAELIGTSEATLKRHITNVFSKLGMESRAQLIVRARGSTATPQRGTALPTARMRP